MKRFIKKLENYYDRIHYWNSKPSTETTIVIEMDDFYNDDISLNRLVLGNSIGRNVVAVFIPKKLNEKEIRILNGSLGRICSKYTKWYYEFR